MPATSLLMGAFEAAGNVLTGVAAAVSQAETVEKSERRELPADMQQVLDGMQAQRVELAYFMNAWDEQKLNERRAAEEAAKPAADKAPGFTPAEGAEALENLEKNGMPPKEQRPDRLKPPVYRVPKQSPEKSRQKKPEKRPNRGPRLSEIPIERIA